MVTENNIDSQTATVPFPTEQNATHTISTDAAVASEKCVSVPYKLTKLQKVYIFFKNITDWIIAFVTLLVFSPFWIVVAIVIRADSKGPALFRHDRIGKNGKKFTCCKWRSMSTDAPRHLASREFNDADAYITRIGQFLRKTSIDEFGQLFNILAGQMNLIGYRPLVEREEFVGKLRREKGIYQIKPGITGWAQVHGRDLVTDEEKANLDEYYLKHLSLWLDIKIFFLTIKKIVFRSDIKEGSI